MCPYSKNKRKGVPGMSHAVLGGQRRDGFRNKKGKDKPENITSKIVPFNGIVVIFVNVIS
jgi:hypothetical protein